MGKSPELRDLINFIDNFLRSKESNSTINDYRKKLKKIEFTSPKFQTGELHPETRCKFFKIYSIALNKGFYGPFYRYTPDSNELKANNDIGGYFTNEKINCVTCAKINLWLYKKTKSTFIKIKNYLGAYVILMLKMIPMQHCLWGKLLMEKLCKYDLIIGFLVMTLKKKMLFFIKNQ